MLMSVGPCPPHAASEEVCIILGSEIIARVCGVWYTNQHVYPVVGIIL